MIKIKKYSERLIKTLKTHDQVTLPVILMFLSLCGIGLYKHYFFPINTSNLSDETKAYPPYTEERKKFDEQTIKRIAEEKAIANASYEFRKIEINEVLNDYHIKLSDLSSKNLNPVECLVNSLNKEKPYIIEIKPDKLKDKKAFAFATEILNHEFSDEVVYRQDDSSTTTAYQRESSKHEVTFTSICRLENIYFFVFNSTGDKTHIGGGGSAPSHIAFSDESGKLNILENPNSNHIKLPKEIGSGLNTTTGIAYYGCRHVYAANSTEVVYKCAGGDGPAMAGGLFLLDLVSKESMEKYFCVFSSASEYKAQCFNQKGEVYYQEKN